MMLGLKVFISYRGVGWDGCGAFRKGLGVWVCPDMVPLYRSAFKN